MEAICTFLIQTNLPCWVRGNKGDNQSRQWKGRKLQPEIRVLHVFKFVKLVMDRWRAIASLWQQATRVIQSNPKMDSRQVYSIFSFRCTFRKKKSTTKVKFEKELLTVVRMSIGKTSFDREANFLLLNSQQIIFSIKIQQCH